MSDGTISVNGSYDGTATLALDEGFEQDAGTVTALSGTIDVTGDYNQLAGSATFTSSTVALTGTFDLGGSTTIANSGLTAEPISIASGAMLYGRGGTITGDVTNAGTLDLIIGTSVNALNVTGNYTQTSAGTMTANLAGTTSNGKLNVSGTAYLDGTLNVQLIDGFMPYPGNQFLIIWANQLSGTFASMNLPGLTQGHWVPSYSTQTLTLAVWYN
jgi:hypothetical protein